MNQMCLHRAAQQTLRMFSDHHKATGNARGRTSPEAQR